MARDTHLFGAFIDGRRAGERIRVAGVTVQPFSVWHHFQLQAMDSPFVRQGEVRRLDLLRALAVCRTRYPDSHLRLPAWRTLWPLRRGIAPAVGEFLRYTGEYLLYRPEYAVVESGARGPREQITSAPELMRLIGDVVTWAGGEPEPGVCAWDLPIGKAYWYQAMGLRARGVTLSFLDDEERAFQDEMRAEEERQREEAEKGGS